VIFRFAEPHFLIFLWVVPALTLIYLAVELRARRRLSTQIGERLAPFLTQSVSTRRRHLKFMLRLLTLVFFIVALARPQSGKSEQKVKTEGLEMVIALDVSNSMLAEDVKPSRLQLAKSEIVRLLELSSGDRIGLVAFAGSAVLISPLTTDHSAIQMFLESVNTNSVETQGTDLKKALRESRAAFERGGVDPGEESQVTRVILLVSDGEDHEEGVTQEAKKLVDEGVRIFSLLVGTERGGQIPIRDERGYIQGYKKDRSGREVMTQTKGTVLRELSQSGKGSFYQASFGGEEIRMLKDDFNRLEKSEFDSAMQVQYNERFQSFLLFGLLLALLDLLISERKSQAAQIWRGRFEASA